MAAIDIGCSGITVQHAATIAHAYCATLLLPKQVHHKFCLIVINNNNNLQVCQPMLGTY